MTTGPSARPAARTRRKPLSPVELSGVSPGAGTARTGSRAGAAGAEQADGGGWVDSVSGVCRGDLCRR
ncbi:hypothetical protein ACWDE0_01755 [Streptomyces sp. 900105755]